MKLKLLLDSAVPFLGIFLVVGCGSSTPVTPIPLARTNNSVQSPFDFRSEFEEFENQVPVTIIESSPPISAFINPSQAQGGVIPHALYCRYDSERYRTYDPATAQFQDSVIARSALMRLTQGPNTGLEVYAAEGGGCIDRNIRDIWNQTRNSEFMRWGDNQFSSQVVNERTAVSPINFHFVANLRHTVCTWDMDWIHQLQEGSLENPLSVIINYSISHYMSIPFFGRPIEHWEGTIKLTQLADNVTSFRMNENLKTARTTGVEAEQSVRTKYERLLHP